MLAGASLCMLRGLKRGGGAPRNGRSVGIFILTSKKKTSEGGGALEPTNYFSVGDTFEAKVNCVSSKIKINVLSRTYLNIE